MIVWWRADPTVTDYQTELTFGLIWLGRAVPLGARKRGDRAFATGDHPPRFVSIAEPRGPVRSVVAHALLAAVGRSEAELEKAAAALRLAVSDG